jgi:ankyrin repeat protein
MFTNNNIWTLLILLLFSCDIKSSQKDYCVELHKLVYEGDIQRTKSILDEHPELVNYKDKKGYTPLHVAAWCKNIEMVKCLISNGSNINEKTNEGNSVLHLAVSPLDRKTSIFLFQRELQGGRNTTTLSECSNLEKLADLLISYGLNVNEKNESGCTALHYACFNPDCPNLIEYLISKGADVNVKTDSNNTPLHNASIFGDKKIVEILLSHGARTNERDEFEQTPLHNATLNLRYDVAKLLLENGAEVNITDRWGKTPLENSFPFPSETISNKTGQPISDYNDFWNSKTKKFDRYPDMIKTAEILLSHGADPNTKSKYGEPLFYYGVVHGYKELVELFLKYGADVNIKDGSGCAAIHLAAMRGNKDIIELLLKKGADINTKDNEGCSALHYAALQGKKDVVELLIAQGADVNTKDNEGKGPLSLAVEKGYTEIADLLRKHAGTM